VQKQPILQSVAAKRMRILSRPGAQEQSSRTSSRAVRRVQ
jgi:hypothetical protein